MRIRRHRSPDVEPIEIWHRSFGSVGPLHARASPQRLDSGHLWTAVRCLQEEHGLAAAYVGGGLAASLDGTGAPRSLRIAWSPHGRFVGEPGGARLLGPAGGLVVDVGQTAIKATRIDGGRTRSVHPHRPGARAEATLARVLAAEMAAGAPPGLVLALPCALDASGVPSACTFPGWEGNADRIPGVLRTAVRELPDDHPWREAEVLLLNDAELAAETARDELVERPALVLTLGFGPGAAILR